MSYLLARPALRSALGEAQPTEFESGLLASLRSRVGKATPAELFKNSAGPEAARSAGVEAIFAALFLARDDSPRGRLSAETETAFDRMWAMQIKAGASAGAWEWNTFDLDPWEMPESQFYGAAIAALATGEAPGGYQSRPAIRENVQALVRYFQENEAAQPLHNRLVLLWASTKLHGAISKDAQHAIAAAARAKQEEDGGWTLASLGAWKHREAAPPAEGSNAYATALTAFVLRQVGSTDDPAVRRALGWLRAHQNAEGYWDASSMNKKYAAGSMQLLFMRDAATGFASLALAK
jgi:squalene-hopene/tetraprenyl-beta-curcumene cyclase